jgi:hypothetical protein
MISGELDDEALFDRALIGGERSLDIFHSPEYVTALDVERALQLAQQHIDG